MIKRLWRAARDRNVSPTVDQQPCVPPTVVHDPALTSKHRGPTKRLRRRR